ncbi:hypothetical protein [Persephonella sp.]
MFVAKTAGLEKLFHKKDGRVQQKGDIFAGIFESLKAQEKNRKHTTGKNKAYFPVHYYPVGIPVKDRAEKTPKLPDSKAVSFLHSSTDFSAVIQDSFSPDIHIFVNTGSSVKKSADNPKSTFFRNLPDNPESRKNTPVLPEKNKNSGSVISEKENRLEKRFFSKVDTHISGVKVPSRDDKMIDVKKADVHTSGAQSYKKEHPVERMPEKKAEKKTVHRGIPHQNSVEEKQTAKKSVRQLQVIDEKKKIPDSKHTEKTKTENFLQTEKAQNSVYIFPAETEEENRQIPKLQLRPNQDKKITSGIVLRFNPVEDKKTDLHTVQKKVYSEKAENIPVEKKEKHPQIKNKTQNMQAIYIRPDTESPKKPHLQNRLKDDSYLSTSDHITREEKTLESRILTQPSDSKRESRPSSEKASPRPEKTELQFPSAERSAKNRKKPDEYRIYSEAVPKNAGEKTSLLGKSSFAENTGYTSDKKHSKKAIQNSGKMKEKHKEHEIIRHKIDPDIQEKEYVQEKADIFKAHNVEKIETDRVSVKQSHNQNVSVHHTSDSFQGGKEGFSDSQSDTGSGSYTENNKDAQTDNRFNRHLTFNLRLGEFSLKARYTGNSINLHLMIKNITEDSLYSLRHEISQIIQESGIESYFLRIKNREKEVRYISESKSTPDKKDTGREINVKV